MDILTNPVYATIAATFIGIILLWKFVGPIVDRIRQEAAKEQKQEDVINVLEKTVETYKKEWSDWVDHTDQVHDGLIQSISNLRAELRIAKENSDKKSIEVTRRFDAIDEKIKEVEHDSKKDRDVIIDNLNNNFSTLEKQLMSLTSALQKKID